MAVTFQDLKRRSLVLLSEAANTPILDLETGTGSTPTASWLTDDNLGKFINEARAILCRTCLPLYRSGTVAATIGQRYYKYTGLTVTGGEIWAARAVLYNSQQLEECSQGFLDAWYNEWTETASGTPLYWSAHGENEVTLYPSPSATSTITVHGLLIPTALTGTDAVTFLADDEAWSMSLYGALMAAKANVDEPMLESRIGLWEAEWDRVRQGMWERLDEPMKRRFYPTPPVKAV
jgi:hypothetical protein